MPRTKRGEGILPSFDVPSNTYFTSALILSTTTSAAQTQKVFRAGLIVLKKPVMCNRIAVYVSVVPTTGTGSDASAVRLYPADADGNPITGALPFLTVGGVSLSPGGAAGWKYYDPPSAVLLPRLFWCGIIHDYQGAAPTVVSWASGGTPRSVPQSAAGADPATTPISSMGYGWTEATYDTGSARGWGYATPALVTQAVAPYFRVP